MPRFPPVCYRAPRALNTRPIPTDLPEALTVSAAQSSEMTALASRARAAGRALSRAGGARRTAGLLSMASALEAAQAEVLAANAADVSDARARGLSGAMLDRLTLDEKALVSMARGLREVAAQEDPLGEVEALRVRPNGLRVGRMRIPLGVVGIVYEARPNVTVDAAGLCLKSGNATLLRGGSEAHRSNAALVECLRAALTRADLPADAVLSLPSTDRAWILAMVQAEGLVDLVIPRGGEALIRFVTAHARVPVIQHYKGVCHVFVDRAARLDDAVEICLNAKVQRPGVCNAMETLLVHADVADVFLPRVAAALTRAGVELRGCPRTCALVPEAGAADDTDWAAEYLDLVLAVRVVDDLDAAVAHIERWGSDHTESIVSQDYGAVNRFLAEVNSAVVMANASTRFADGAQLGLGAEIGISTSRLHAYGPMGARELTTQKFVVYGSGHVRT